MIGTTVSLRWNDVSGATQYDLGVRDMTTNQLIVDQRVNGTSFNVNLVAGRQYRWNVAACNSAGCSSFTAPLFFVSTTVGQLQRATEQPLASTPLNIEQNYADDYPYSGAAIDTVDPWNFYYRECTSYVAWRSNRDAGTRSSPYFFHNLMGGGRWSNADNWEQNARTLGYRVDTSPERGAIAHWRASEIGSVGHVAYVERVNADGSVDVTVSIGVQSAPPSASKKDPSQSRTGRARGAMRSAARPPCPGPAWLMGLRSGGAPVG